MTTGPRYKRKTDSNHATIVKQLTSTPGVFVQDVSRFPGLGWDLIVTCQSRRPRFILLVEVKHAGDPSNLTESERRARAHFGDNWIEAEAVEPILKRLGVIE